MGHPSRTALCLLAAMSAASCQAASDGGVMEAIATRYTSTFTTSCLGREFQLSSEFNRLRGHQHVLAATVNGIRVRSDGLRQIDQRLAGLIRVIAIGVECGAAWPGQPRVSQMLVSGLKPDGEATLITLSFEDATLSPAAPPPPPTPP